MSAPSGARASGPWHQDVTAEQWRAFFAAYLGWMLDGFDFTILTFLLVEIQREFNIAYLFISHNLAVVEHLSDRIAILYLGKIVEVLRTDRLHRQAVHPYTRALIDAIPVPDPTVRQFDSVLMGEIPGAMSVPRGCRFNPRCEHAIGRCFEEEPPLEALGDGHHVACHLHLQRSTKGIA